MMQNMVTSTKKTQLGWEVPDNVKDAFRDFCIHIGSVAQEDCAGSLFLWQHMPPQIREWAKLEAKGAPVVEVEFWTGLNAEFERKGLGMNDLRAAHEKKKLLEARVKTQEDRADDISTHMIEQFKIVFEELDFDYDEDGEKETVKRIKPLLAALDRRAIEDENAAGRARGGPKRTRAKHKSAKSG